MKNLKQQELMNRFQIEEMEDRLEMKAWIDKCEVKLSCEVKV